MKYTFVKDEEHYEFIYANNVSEIFFFVMIVPSLILYIFLSEISIWMALLSLLLFLVLFLLLKYVPQIGTYKGYGKLTEEGVEIQLRFSNYTMVWNELKWIEFRSAVFAGSRVTAGINFLTDNNKQRCIALSGADKEQSLYCFFRAIEAFCIRNGIHGFTEHTNY